MACRTHRRIMANGGEAGSAYSARNFSLKCPPVGYARAAPDAKRPAMTLQTALSAYLAAEFRHAIGAYMRPVDVLLDSAADPPGGLAETLRSLRTELGGYNATLASKRFAVDPGIELRHPAPPTASTLGPSGPRVLRWPATERDCIDYYATVIAALRSPKVAEPTGELGLIRRALLLGVEDDSRRIRALEARFVARDTRLRERLGGSILPAGHARASKFWNADLDRGGHLAASIMEAATEAHWLLLQVQHERSGPVGHVMQRVADGASALDDTLLGRAVELNTLVFSIAEAMPWIFAADERQRLEAQVPNRGVRDRVNPEEPLWIARRVILLALYRRAMVWRLLGDHRRAYNDYWKTQHIIRLTTGAPIGKQRRLELSLLDALAEYRIAELYRADRDYRQALVHCCRSHDRVETLLKCPDPEIKGPAQSWIENSHWRVSVLMSKGKAFYEQGQMKRACKWFLRAWLALGDVAATSRYAPMMSETTREEVESVTLWLESVRHEPFISKDAMVHKLAGAIWSLDKEAVPSELRTLAADILDRLGHTLMVMRLPQNTLAQMCLELALALDRWNLLVRSDLLQLRAQPGPKKIELDAGLPDPLRCWPSGGSVVDQVIRTAEHLTRERLDATRKPLSDDDVSSTDQLVAHRLLDDFLTHTDSMHVRAGLVHQHVTPSLSAVNTRWPKAAMEFVCLRRYGSTSPFMARPAAISAVGGGYMVRLLSADSAVNILVDPGEGVVANLYRVGFAITDIDMIIVTHDHPDHMAGLDPILALRKEHGADPTKITILGNESVCMRYSCVEFATATVGPLPAPGDPPLHIGAGDAVTASLCTMDTMHLDLGGNSALGFTLTMDDFDSERVGKLTFMSDAAAQAIDGRTWADAFDADVVVAHVSNASVQELRSLAFANNAPEEISPAFDRARRALSDSSAEHATRTRERLSHALDQPSTVEHKHLLLRGLLGVARRYRDEGAAGSARVLVVGEFKEQLGPFRGKIARHIAQHVFEGENQAALTADIGLRLRIAQSGVTVLCTTCDLNNDRLQSEQYHPATEIHEVCIKGNFEGMAWNCERHDPGTSQPARFLERTAGYDVYGPAGLFHG